MARGTALLVGLRSVDPQAYGGWDGTSGCWGCELDVDNLAALLEEQDFSVVTLKTEAATAARVLRGLSAASQVTQPDDLFVFYFSGHGGQQPDFDGDESDGHDETLICFDREVIDDELNEIWPRFPDGARIFMLSDSCNSGTNYRMPDRNVGPEAATPVLPVPDSQGMRAQMIHMGGCRDSSTSAGYRMGGAFTMSLCNAWDGGEFSGDYADFYDAIVAGVHTGQKPQMNQYGPVSQAYLQQRPFQV